MTKRFTILKDEYWYGGAVNDGYLFPADGKTSYRINVSHNDTYNQINPVFVSSKGRYIWLERGGEICFENGEIKIEADEIEVDETSQSLKQAQLKAAKKHFAPNGEYPDASLYKNPQLCTWMGLFNKQDQENVISFAKNYLSSGAKAGLIIIDDHWQKGFGDWDFKKNLYPNPKQMVKELHDLGFKVSLWVVPYVALNYKEVFVLQENGALIADENGTPLIAKWFDGETYALNFKNDYAKKWFKGKLDYLHAQYDIDGFKFDCGDEQYLPNSYKDGNLQSQLYADCLDGLKEYFFELRCCVKSAGNALIQRLADRTHSWGIEYVKDERLPGNGYMKYGLSTVLPNMLTQGLTGYFYGCPDMVGGGLGYEMLSKQFDKELLIRSLQLSTLMPMLQFSFPIWDIDDEDAKKSLKECFSLREKLMPYITGLYINASKTGEPIVRYMEYEFPHEGYEKEKSMFMLGDRYLVAPVIEKGLTERVIRFPKNTVWKDVNTNREYSETVTVSANIHTLPVFERIS